MSQAQRLTLAGDPAPPVLATGAWMSNAVAALHSNEARLSAMTGDLENAEACAAHDTHCTELLTWLGRPALIAHDLHPDFHSTRHALSLARTLGTDTLPVQHHHAHIAATCAEHGVREPVLGVALDGVGLGSDGEAWGGELLRVDGAHCQRLGSLRPLPMPGGDVAAREPWRMALAVLHELGRADQARARFASEACSAALLDLLTRHIRCPRTSSAGRLFDGAAGLLGMCTRMTAEAQAARALEAAATRHIETCGWPAPVTEGWAIASDAFATLSFLPMLAILSDTADAADTANTDGAPRDAAAAQFHATLIAGLADWAEQASGATDIRVIALGGGCFYNQLLASKLPAELARRGLRCLRPERVPAGDAGLALGQAWVAAHSLVR